MTVTNIRRTGRAVALLLAICIAPIWKQVGAQSCAQNTTASQTQSCSEGLCIWYVTVECSGCETNTTCGPAACQCNGQLVTQTTCQIQDCPSPCQIASRFGNAPQGCEAELAQPTRPIAVAMRSCDFDIAIKNPNPASKEAR